MVQGLQGALSATGRLNPKPKTLNRVHYRQLDADTKLVENRAEEHPKAELQKGFTRMDMPLGANIMRSFLDPNPNPKPETRNPKPECPSAPT